MNVKKVLLFFALAGAVSAAITGVKLHAQESLPAKMDMVDAAQLDAALAHLRELEQAAKPHSDRVVGVCKKYKIDPAGLGKTVGIDFTTGQITRVEPKK